MRRSAYDVFATFTVLVSLAAACTGDSASPTAVLVDQSSLPFPGMSASEAGSFLSVVAAQRTTPLTRDVIASVVIGRKGGKIKSKETGFELRVPKGAVRVKTIFQVKALAGSIVAYEFEPHGTRFAVPLTFSQSTKDIVGGSAGLSPLLGYFSSAAQLNQTTGRASVSEVSTAIVITDVHGKKIEGNIFHFSGYLVSSGRAQ